MIKGKDILFICICGLLLLTGNSQAEIRINDILSVNGIGNYILFPDGTTQDTATLVGPVGPQGPTGPQGATGAQGPAGANSDLKVAKCANQFCMNNWWRR
jgi:hypothetical protein